LSVHINRDAGMAQLRITDSGQGLPESLHQRLFQPFATGNSRSGTGLGLTIAREIVLSLGGSIQLTNRMLNGQIAGLDAIVRLPLAVTPEA
jgi:two-component system sensor histidine kinase TctE